VSVRSDDKGPKCSAMWLLCVLASWNLFVEMRGVRCQGRSLLNTFIRMLEVLIFHLI